MDLEEQYFLIQNIAIERSQDFENSAISRCSVCGEYIPESLVEKRNDGVYCKACGGKRYYKVL